MMKCGEACIHMESAHYGGLDENERICPMCNINQIESEIHVVLSCPLYNNIRDPLLLKANDIDSNFYYFNDQENICIPYRQ